MNKLIVAMMFSTALFAAEKTTVEFKLTAETYDKEGDAVKINIKKLNKDLKAKGLDGVPEVVVVSEGAAAYNKVMMKRIEAAAVLFPKRISTPIDSGYYYEYSEMCYRGKASEVPAVLNAMLGNFLTDEQGNKTYEVRFWDTTSGTWILHKTADIKVAEQAQADQAQADINSPV